jgi:hypothetical protein
VPSPAPQTSAPPFPLNGRASLRFISPPSPPPIPLLRMRTSTSVRAKVRPYWAILPSLPAMAAVGRRAWSELLRPPFPPRFAFNCPTWTHVAAARPVSHYCGRQGQLCR